MTAKKIVKKTPTKKVTKKATVKKVAKKVTKKAPTKKTKTTTPKVVHACKTKCNAKQAFWVNNGPVVHSMHDLFEALKTMTDEQYAYHTKREGNDFVNWVKDCLKDSACAMSLKRVQSRTGAIRVLSKKCTCK